jgi:hypothetical protein
VAEILGDTHDALDHKQIVAHRFLVGSLSFPRGADGRHQASSEHRRAGRQGLRSARFSAGFPLRRGVTARPPRRRAEVDVVARARRAPHDDDLASLPLQLVVRTVPSGHAARFIMWAILGRYKFWPVRWTVEPRPADPPYTDLLRRHRDGDTKPLIEYVLACIK